MVNDTARAAAKYRKIRRDGKDGGAVEIILRVPAYTPIDGLIAMAREEETPDRVLESIEIVTGQASVDPSEPPSDDPPTALIDGRYPSDDPPTGNVQ